MGEIRGMGYFYGIELVKDKKTKAASRAPRATACCARCCRPGMFELGLHCRADDRGDPVIQLAPPLIAGPEEFDLMVGVIRQALIESMEAL